MELRVKIIFITLNNLNYKKEAGTLWKVKLESGRYFAVNSTFRCFKILNKINPLQIFSTKTALKSPPIKLLSHFTKRTTRR